MPGPSLRFFLPAFFLLAGCAAPSYRETAFKTVDDSRLQSLLLALQREEPLLAKTFEHPETDSGTEGLATVKRCKDVERSLGQRADEGAGESVASHVIAMLSDREDACFYEIYLLELIGRLVGIENPKRVQLPQESARRLFSVGCLKCKDAKGRWFGDLRWMYLTLWVELAQEIFRGEPTPPAPTMDDAQWDEKMDRFFDWLRQRVDR